MNKIIFILGGARSGKSSFAEELAEKIAGQNVVYLATAQALDEEMEDRIAHHQENRSKEWETIEEPFELSKKIENIKKGKTVLIDCLTLFISNLLLKNDKESNKDNIETEIIMEIKEVINKAENKEINLIIVSNEVGQGLVPNSKLGRKFRDITGRANQCIADIADKVYLTFAGYPIDLKEISLNKKNDFLKDLKEDYDKN